MGKGSERALEQRLKSLSELVVALGQAVEVVMREQQAQAAAMRALTDLQAAQGDDVRRGVDRVLGAVSGAEQAVVGEVRSVEARVGALADDVRIVRVLRDGLESLAQGVDDVRQLTARGATSQQMGELTRELGTVLSEIEQARSRVLQVEHSPGPTSGPMADVVVVGADVDELGRRIDRLAEVMEERLAPAAGPAPDGDTTRLAAERLRRLSVAARRLGAGVLDDMRTRRAQRP